MIRVQDFTMEARERAMADALKACLYGCRHPEACRYPHPRCGHCAAVRLLAELRGRGWS